MSHNNTPATPESAPVDENQLIAERREKLNAMFPSHDTLLVDYSLSVATDIINSL